MNWENLLDNQCPKCETDLEERDGYMVCLEIDCDFKINLKKFHSLKEKIEDDQLDRESRWE